MNNKTPHIPVLLKEVLESLSIQKSGIYVDGTFGAGGYTKAILDSFPSVQVIAIDQDETAIINGQKLVEQYAPRLTLIHGRFGDMDKLITNKVDGVVLDIGVSSMQIDQPERGFSFQKDGPLDMRMGQSDMTAADVVNTLDEKELADIIYLYGEERFSRKIAHQIILNRPFQTTLELAKTIHQVVPYKGGIDTATKTFQALRIYVNDELGELRRGLQGAMNILKDGGVLSVVSFHSLEDRIIKDFLVSHSTQKSHINKYKKNPSETVKEFELLYKKPIAASEEEIKFNFRSRSAHLRSAKRRR